MYIVYGLIRRINPDEMKSADVIIGLIKYLLIVVSIAVMAPMYGENILFINPLLSIIFMTRFRNPMKSSSNILVIYSIILAIDFIYWFQPNYVIPVLYVHIYTYMFVCIVANSTKYLRYIDSVYVLYLITQAEMPINLFYILLL